MAIQIKQLPESFRDEPFETLLQKIKELEKELPDDCIFWNFKNSQAVLSFGHADKNLALNVFVPSNQSLKQVTNLTNGKRLSGTTLGEIVDIFDSVVQDYSRFFDGRSNFYAAGKRDIDNRIDDLISEPSPRPQKMPLLKKERAFMELHGRGYLPGEPETGFIVPLFKDHEKDPLVVDSVLWRDEKTKRPLILFASSLNKETGNIEFRFDMFGNKKISVDAQKIPYFKSLTKKEFCERYRLFEKSFQSSIRSFYVVDQFFKFPMPLPVAKKIAERINENPDERFLERHGELYLLRNERFVLLAADRSENTAHEFFGKILLGKRSIGKSKDRDSEQNFGKDHER